MYAIIQTGGKQYRVEEGQNLYIEKLDYEPEEEVVFDQVLAISKDSDLILGKPLVEGASVTAKLVKNGKGKKIRIIKHKAKKGYMRKQGHRQPYSQVLIEKING